jgi:ligand-binding sensor domain-containing protein/AraC-like DNA-binding protein
LFLFIMSLIKLLVLVAAICTPFYSFSLDPSKKLHHYVHRSWQSVDGLPQNSAHSIVQGEKGYIWIATQEGLVRFDGNRFKVYSRLDYPELGSNDIRTLALGKDGTLWIGTYGGGAVNLKNGKMKAFNTDNGLSGNLVRTIYVDEKNCAWVGTFKHGLNSICNGEITHYTTENGIPDNNIRSIAGDGSTVYIGTTKGLAVFEDGKVSKVVTEDDGLENSNVSAVYVDSKGNLFAGTKNGFLHSFQNGKITSHFIPGSVEADFINEIYEDRHGSLWLGTEKGIHRFTDGFFESFSVKDGLTYEAVRSIIEDKEGNLWIGTSGGGINLFTDGKILTLSIDDGLSSGDILPVLFDSYGNLWMGTALKGLDMMTPEGSVYNYSTQNGLIDNRILSLTECSDKNIWVGTVSGITVLKSDGTLKNVTFNGEKFLKPVSAIVQSDSGEIFASTHGEGIFRIDAFEIVDSLGKDKGLGDGVVLSFLEEKPGKFWIGTMNGLYLFDKEEFSEFGKSSELSGNAVYSLYFDKNGVLWIGTDAGFNYIENDDLYTVTDKDFLFGDSIYAIISHNDNLFVSSNKGIFKALIADLKENGKTGKDIPSVRRYDFSDGMKSMECNGGYLPSVTVSPDGKLLFPTINGVAQLDPEIEIVNNIIPEVIVESLISERNSFLEIYNQRGAYIFDAGSDRFEFHYTATSFVNPSKVQFRYMLEGFDKDFVDAGNRRVAYYTNLEPGAYRFRVIASNNEEVWNLEGDQVEFVIAPFFHQTKGFYIFLYMIVLVVTAIPFTMIYIRKIKKIKAANKELEKRAIEAEKKYQKAKLSEEVSTNCLESLFELMDTEKLYRNPVVKIHDIAKKLSISHIYLSQIINLHTGMTFYTLLSLYRVSEVMEKLSLIENLDENVISLAYEAGFNTKSSFNSAFKKFTNLTPTQYRKKYSKTVK